MPICNLEGPLDDVLFDGLDEESYYKLEGFIMKKETVEDLMFSPFFGAKGEIGIDQCLGN